MPKTVFLNYTYLAEEFYYGLLMKLGLRDHAGFSTLPITTL